ncbi:hypothetical protein L581_0784 [Serratia fonticola AU-AP2C]|nr:hypothetical protein L581_0784 [Serratia fonticola AU-AP2C]
MGRLEGIFTGVLMIVVLLTKASPNRVKQLQVIVMRWLPLNVAKAGSKRCTWIARSSRKNRKRGNNFRSRSTTGKRKLCRA